MLIHEYGDKLIWLKLKFYWGNKGNKVVYVNLEQNKYELLIVVEGPRQSMKILEDGTDMISVTSKG